MILQSVRIDRWLWSVRAYKTRSLAVDACRRSWVTVNGSHAKPSREIKAEDIVTFKVGPLEKKVRVLQILEKRISAKLVEQYLEDLTSKKNYDEARKKRVALISPSFGKRVSRGRPSKKERRDLEDFFYGTEEK